MKLQIVAIAGRDLRDMQDAWGAVVELKQYVAIVIQSPARAYRGEVGTDLFHAAPAHVLQQIECMDADIADRSAQPRLRGIRSPHCLLLAFSLGGVAQPTLRIFPRCLAFFPQPPAPSH